jgi:hypothetical protein
VIQPVAAVAVALGGAVLALLPGQIPGAGLAAIGDMTSPAFFPILAALLVLAAGAALLLRPAAPVPAEADAEDAGGIGKPLIFAAMMIGGALLTPVLGGLLTLFLLMCGAAAIAGARRPVPTLLVAACGVLVVHLLFERTLKVLLPPGLLFG